jgi:hypothetical protein
MRLARLRGGSNSKSSGVSSMKRVWQSPETNFGCFNTFIRNGMFVFTPRMRNSASARAACAHVRSKLVALLVSFTRSES